MVLVDAAPFEASDELKRFEQSVEGAGAIVSFSGYVRDQAGDQKVLSLELQAYSPLTETSIEEAVSEANKRWPLIGVHIRHRIGKIAPGEAIVFTAAASAHRRAAFEAADFLMDYLKTHAVFWKKEVTPEGEHWIEPRSEDYDDQARWEQTNGS